MRTSINEGTLQEKSEPVLEIPCQTASGVGTGGGEAGLNAAITKPLVGYAEFRYMANINIAIASQSRMHLRRQHT